ncbi:fatty acid cis/trans isomerase [Ruegeria arenilitoris]|uniref:fatty acid cis/trans isomerase n=1 Tax=Ruegeria arenilitoris TaxID=1173585 RepID=UPI00147E2F74|nr:fatty acid cis/trans isomerase [Ruegeria arenilitoris]
MPIVRQFGTWAKIVFAAVVLVIVLSPSNIALADTKTAGVVSQPQQNWAEVKTILDRRCVVCHSCYDAPCQLKLTSPQGLLRGASKEAVYHTERLKDAQPTRLGIDAQTVPEWVRLGFFPILHTEEQSKEDSTLLEKYLNLGREYPLSANNPVPDELGLAIDRPLVCPTSSEFGDFRNSHPLAGMPYAAAPLSENDFHVFTNWVRRGAPISSSLAEMPAEIQSQIDAWEAFLNGSDLRNRLMSRYLYEHLFLARLHFDNDDSRRFFKLVRSITPPGKAIDVVATRRPFDNPGIEQVHYRLQVIDESIVHKEHLVYTLSPDRMSRFKELFLDTDWNLFELPPYGTAEGGNPFSTFSAIPARSRYQFLLDDALFFVRSFIRGPVCHGETAVDVIEDRFWVSFLDPDADLSVTDPDFLENGAQYLELPVSDMNDGALGDLQAFSHKNQVRYIEYRDSQYRNSSIFTTGFDYSSIWDGDGDNPDARITVFRHFDNASAMTGYHGAVPETAWIIDFPIFERIYYDLVAGYDVFGRVEHQLSTRLYMDELRMESEDLFLSFMPEDVRQEMHNGWYKGTLAELHTYWHRRHVDNDFPSGIEFTTPNPKKEFLVELLRNGKGLWPVSDAINRCSPGDCLQHLQDPIDQTVRGLANQRGPWVQYLPDLSILIVETEDGSSRIFSLAHDKAHTNVAFLFDEEARREPQSDVLTVIPGLFASYPNFFFNVRQEKLGDFIKETKAVQSQDEWMELVAEYGVRRTSPDFWETSDFLNTFFLDQSPIEAGILDLNRYKDPKKEDDPT